MGQQQTVVAARRSVAAVSAVTPLFARVFGVALLDVAAGIVRVNRKGWGHQPT